MSTLKVKLNSDTDTPGVSVLKSGVSGNWPISADRVSQGLDTIEIYDEASAAVYTAPILSLTEAGEPQVVGTNGSIPRYAVAFNNQTVQVTELTSRDFKFNGWGVAYGD